MLKIRRKLYKLTCVKDYGIWDVQEYSDSTGEKVGEPFVLQIDYLIKFINNTLDSLEKMGDTKNVGVCFVDDIIEVANECWIGSHNFDMVKKVGKPKVKVSVHSLLFSDRYANRIKNLKYLSNKDILYLLNLLLTDVDTLETVCKKHPFVHEKENKKLKKSKLKSWSKLKKKIEAEEPKDLDTMDACSAFGEHLVLGEVGYDETADEILSIEDELKELKLESRLISFEGGEGSGKTTQIKKLAALLEKAGYKVMCLREPGGSKIAEQIREVIVSKENKDITNRCEALCFAAARAQLVEEKILPALDEGYIVILDRYVDSSLVYQGNVEGLGQENIEQINEFAMNDLYPDITFYIDVPVEVGFERIAVNNRETNRLDELGKDFHESVRKYYKKLVDYFDRIVEIDGNASEDVVFNRVVDSLIKFWE